MANAIESMKLLAGVLFWGSVDLVLIGFWAGLLLRAVLAIAKGVKNGR